MSKQCTSKSSFKDLKGKDRVVKRVARGEHGRLTTFKKPHIERHKPAHRLVMIVNAKFLTIFILFLPNLVHPLGPPAMFLQSANSVSQESGHITTKYMRRSGWQKRTIGEDHLIVADIRARAMASLNQTRTYNTLGRYCFPIQTILTPFPLAAFSSVGSMISLDLIRIF